MVGRFDGVALAAVTPGQRRPDQSTAHDGPPIVRLPDGGRALLVQPLGMPRTLPVLAPADADGPCRTGTDAWRPTSTDRGIVEVAVFGLEPPPWSASATPGRELTTAVRQRGGDVDRLAVLPPVVVADLVAVAPLRGGRTHLGVHGAATTACGRLPLRGQPAPPGQADCLRCLRAASVAERLDRQHAHYPLLVALAGPLLAGAATRLWQRLAHRDPGTHPELLDAMVGAVAYRLPGAPDTDDILPLIRRHLDAASPEVRHWAAQQSLTRLDREVRRLAVRHPTKLPPGAEQQLALNSGVMDPAAAAEVLVAALEEVGPAPALEPVALRVATRAGAEVCDRVERWRRRHRVAAALGSGPRHHHSPATTIRRTVQT